MVCSCSRSEIVVPVSGVWSMSMAVGGGRPYNVWKREVPMEEW